MLGRAAPISAAALAQHMTPKPRVTQGPQTLSPALLSCRCCKNWDQCRDPSDPISGFLSLSIYTISPFLALANNLPAGFAASADFEGGTKSFICPQEQTEVTALSSGRGVGVGGGGVGISASIPALLGRLGKFPIDSGLNCLYRVTATVSRRGRAAASPGPIPAPGWSRDARGERGHSPRSRCLAL